MRKIQNKLASLFSLTQNKPHQNRTRRTQIELTEQVAARNIENQIKLQNSATSTRNNGWFEALHNTDPK